MPTEKEFEPPVEECYYENRRNFPQAELAKYYGQHVAWSRDGKTILANGRSWEDVEIALRDKGIDASRVVFGYVDEPDMSYFG
jgi:hypothetical protein